jgi:hypothetical protein
MALLPGTGRLLELDAFDWLVLVLGVVVTAIVALLL